MSDHSTTTPENCQETSCKVVVCRVCGLEKPRAEKGNGKICDECFTIKRKEIADRWYAKLENKSKHQAAQRACKERTPGFLEREKVRLERQEKQQLLERIIKGLGQEATSATIREECYKQGHGAVHPMIICHVRNKLWPDRKKQNRHNSKQFDRTPSAIVVPGIEAIRAKCPLCSSFNTRVKDVSRLRDGRTRRKQLCKECGHTFLTVCQDDESSLISKRRLMHVGATEKECTICRQILPIDKFGKKANDADMYRSRCRECENKIRHEKGVQSTLASYGVPPDWYDVTLAMQDGKCAICKSTDTGRGHTKGKVRKVFAIDHCHATGKIRGLLCNKCNLGIGNFNDDIDWLEAAVKYLREHAADKRTEDPS